jgi:hypothetical protein
MNLRYQLTRRSRRAGHGRGSVRLIGSLLVAAAVVSGAGSLAPAVAVAARTSHAGQPPAAPVASSRLIVRVSPGGFNAAAAAVRAAGGHVVARQPALDMFVAEGRRIWPPLWPRCRG